MVLWEKINGVEGNREGPRRAGLAGEGGDTSLAPLRPGSGVAQTRTSARAGQSRNRSLDLHCNWVPDQNKLLVQVSATGQPSAAGGSDADVKGQVRGTLGDTKEPESIKANTIACIIPVVIVFAAAMEPIAMVSSLPR